MSSLGGSSSESTSTSSGLRPKGKPQVSNSLKNGKSAFSRSRHAGDGNPLDRLSEIILGWNILEDVANTTRKSFESDKNWQLDGAVDVLPDVYRSYNEYASAWEPIMIKEMQDAIVSKFASTIESALSGTLHSTVASHRSPDSTMQHLESSFNYDGYYGGKR